MSPKNAERTVPIGGMSKPAAHTMASTMRNAPASNISQVAKAVPDFTEVKKKSFTAKYTIIGVDLIVQFFLPTHAEQHMPTPEGRAAWMDYWLKRFPPKLDVIARSHFEAEYPRLMVKWTDEVVSWWFKAQGFGSVTDPKQLAETFLEKLEASLQARDETRPSS
jgi:hypothetical protein